MSFLLISPWFQLSRVTDAGSVYEKNEFREKEKTVAKKSQKASMATGVIRRKWLKGPLPLSDKQLFWSLNLMFVQMQCSYWTFPTFFPWRSFEPSEFYLYFSTSFSLSMVSLPDGCMVGNMVSPSYPSRPPLSLPSNRDTSIIRSYMWIST